MRFAIRATGPTGLFWLSRPFEFGVRRLVARNRADLFLTLEAAERAISAMPKGYKLARISFAIERVGELRPTSSPLASAVR
jgi:hypothetical protein